MRFLTSRQTLLLAFLLILSIIIYRAESQAQRNARATPVDRVVIAGVGSFEWAITGAQNLIAGLFRPLVRARQLDRENQHLKAEVGRLHSSQVRAGELEAENSRLRSLLNLQQHSSYRSIAAEVIGRDPSNWFDTILLDRGRLNGVKPGSVVINAEGVVGRVLEVNDTTSNVLLITDLQSGVGGLIQRTRQPGVVEGRRAALLRLKFLPKDADLKREDVVVTSGLGKVFPAGLPIGRVTRVWWDANEGAKAADILPAADPSRVEQVLIITPGEP